MQNQTTDHQTARRVGLDARRLAAAASDVFHAATLNSAIGPNRVQELLTIVRTLQPRNATRQTLGNAIFGLHRVMDLPRPDRWAGLQFTPKYFLSDDAFQVADTLCDLLAKLVQRDGLRAAEAHPLACIFRSVAGAGRRPILPLPAARELIAEVLPGAQITLPAAAVLTASPDGRQRRPLGTTGADRTAARHRPSTRGASPIDATGIRSA